jgi:hypothetical protein
MPASSLTSAEIFIWEHFRHQFASHCLPQGHKVPLGAIQNGKNLPFGRIKGEVQVRTSLVLKTHLAVMCTDEWSPSGVTRDLF